MFLGILSPVSLLPLLSRWPPLPAARAPVQQAPSVPTPVTRGIYSQEQQWLGEQEFSVQSTCLFTRLESSLVPAVFLTAQFLQKT